LGASFFALVTFFFGAASDAFFEAVSVFFLGDAFADPTSFFFGSVAAFLGAALVRKEW
jgi:hypothetical protein